MPEVRFVGGEKLAAVGALLRGAGDPASAKGIRKRMRAGIVSAVAPVRNEIRAAYRGISVKGTSGSTGLRNALANATAYRVLASSKTTLVRLEVSGSKMPAGKEGMPAAFEGRTFRHPVFPDPSTETRREWTWIYQAGHPTFYRIARGARPRIYFAAIAVVDATVIEIEEGIPQ